MEKKLKRIHEFKEKTRSSREGTPSQEDESDKPHELEYNHLTSQPKS
jgi:hypothetical protein